MNDTTQNDDSFNLANLATYREQGKLSVQAVADEIKVSKDTILHIEAGRFEKLGAPAFLRGHLTNYSKAIGLDPQQVLDHVPPEFLRHQNLQLSGAMGSSPLARVKIQSNHFGRYAVGTALLGMLGLSFYFIWDKWSEPVTQSINPSLSISQESSDNSKKVTYSSLIPQAKQLKTETTETIESSEAAAADVDPTMVDQTSQPANDLSNETHTTDTPPSENLDDGGNMNLQGSIEVDQTAKTAVAAYAIQLDLSEEAWISITAADGNKIVHDILGPGMREFQADQPVHFRMGNANQVKVMINNQTVDINPSTHNNVADFDWPLNPS